MKKSNSLRPINLNITNISIDARLKKPLRAAVVADLHSAPCEWLLQELAQLSPNLILCPGDMLHRADESEAGLDFLRQAAALFPVFCSLGNHECKHGGDIRDAIRATGAALLDNSFARFEDILIGGLSTGYAFGEKQGRLKKTPKPDVKALEGFFAEEGFKILLSHHPEYFDKY